MKRILNDFKNHFKETIRTGTKGKLLSQGHEDVIIRKFKDIDISKDFELRQQRYQMQALEEKNLTKQPTYDDMSLEEIENFYVDKVAEEEIEKRLDINQEVVVSGIKKEVLLNEVILTEFVIKHFPDEKFHPKIIENMQKLHHKLLHNTPIPKRDLFETFPQYFIEEIGGLAEDERKQFPLRKSCFTSIDGNISTPGLLKDNEYLANETFTSQIREMLLYSHFLEKKLLEKYRIFIKQAIEEWGWANHVIYLKAIKDKDEENLTFIEKLIKDEFTQIDLINDEVLYLEEAKRIYDIENETKADFWFNPSPELKKLAEERLEYIFNYRTYRIEDTILIPPNPNPLPDIMDVLRADKSYDIDEIIKKDNEIYHKLINSGLPISRTPPNEKDTELIRKTNLISNSVKEYLKPNDPVLIPNGGAVALDYLEEGFLGSYPAPGRIHVDEYYKTLLLNEENNKRYDFNYWVDYYEIEPAVLRNTFNYVFYPVQDLKNPTEINRIVYFKDPEYEERRKMISSMSTEDFEEYLQKTKERPELEEVKRLDYLKFIETATEPRITKNTIVYDALDEEKKIENPFLYSDVMKAVDKQIEKVVSETVKAEQVALDPDLKMRIEKLKEVKRLESIRYLISDEDRMKKDLLDIEGKNIEKIEADNEQNNKI